MTDISELVQREEFEMWAEEHCALPWGYLKIRRTEDGYSSDYDYTSLWAVWKAARAALEKANQRIAELESRTTAERREWMARSFSEGYDSGHSRGLNCGRLYKSDDGMRGHRHACLRDHLGDNAGEVE